MAEVVGCGIINNSSNGSDGSGMLIIEELFGDQIAKGWLFGIIAAIIVSIGGILWKVYYIIVDYLKRQFVVSITVRQGQSAFQWIEEWMAENKCRMRSGGTGNLIVTTKEGFDSRDNCDDDSDSIKKAKENLLLVPGDGTHLISFQGRTIWLTRTTGDTQSLGWSNKPFRDETMEISAFSRSSKILEDLVQEAFELHFKKRAGITHVHVLDEDAYCWIEACKRPPRPLSSVVLDQGIADSLRDDAIRFFNAESWYNSKYFHIPWVEPISLCYKTLGFLFGGGKTSFVLALAGSLGLGICVLSLTSRSLNDENLLARLREAPKKAVILIEDIDAIFASREAVGKAGAGLSGGHSGGGTRDTVSQVSFSGLLNAIDGVASQEGRLLCMTTNHFELLDPALIRPGRCDVKILFQLASTDQVRALFLRFFPGEESLAIQFSKSIPDRSVSPAALQGHFLKFKDDPHSAINTIPELLTHSTNPFQSSDSSSSRIQIGEWLKRLSLPQKYGSKLERLGIYFLADLQLLDSSDVIELMGVVNKIHASRITGFFEERPAVLHSFALVKPAIVTALFRKYFPTAPESQVNLFSSKIPSDSLSSFEIDAYLSKYLNSPTVAVKNIADHLSVHTAMFGNTDRSTLKSSNGLINFSRNLHCSSVSEWLRRMDLDYLWPKWQEEHGITDSDMPLVMEFGDGDLNELGIEKRGKRWHCQQDLSRLKELVELSV